MAAVLSVIVMVRLGFIDLYSLDYFSFGFIHIKHNILIFVFAAMCFFILGALMERVRIKNVLMPTEKRIYPSCFVAFATILMAVLLHKEVSSKWLTSALTLEGVVVLGTGFWLRQKVYRICALFVLSITALRFVLVDMAGVETIYRIVACILLGTVLILASFVYSRFPNQRGGR
jgi:hypothetical protein